MTNAMSSLHNLLRRRARFYVGACVFQLFPLVIQQRRLCIGLLQRSCTLETGKEREYRAGIFRQSMRARNRVGIGLSYRTARLHRLVEFIPWNRFLGSINVLKYGLR